MVFVELCTRPHVNDDVIRRWIQDGGLSYVRLGEHSHLVATYLAIIRWIA